MKLLYVTKAMPFGAAEAFIFPEIEDHLANGWDVRIAPVAREKLVHRRADALLDRTYGLGLFHPKMFAALGRELLRQPATVLATFGTMLQARPSLWPRNLAVWVKGVWLGNEARRLGIDHIHVHWIAVPATMGLVAARIAGVGMSITCHRYDIAQRNLVPQKFAAATFVRAIDTPGAQELAALLPTGEKRPEIIRMGVKLPETQVVLRDGALDRVRGIIGARLVDKKGHSTLFKAIARARELGVELELDVYGDGPLESRLLREIDELGIADLVHMLGVASHELLLERLLSSDYDVALLPSVTTSTGDKEGIPVFLMEAMAAGLPVISTPNGGISELIDDKTGALVPEYDDEALAGAIVQLASDPALRQSRAVAARAFVQQDFSVEGCCAGLRARIVATTTPRGRI
ncbi:glycosyltransferase [Novosphingobium sp.]|uniref:glycosyltransferase n=1 Tax=Novosphingobium sp. TaxID=1874826 RepID=UPI0038BBD9A0